MAEGEQVLAMNDRNIPSNLRIPGLVKSMTHWLKCIESERELRAFQQFVLDADGVRQIVEALQERDALHKQLLEHAEVRRESAHPLSMRSAVETTPSPDLETLLYGCLVQLSNGDENVSYDAYELAYKALGFPQRLPELKAKWLAQKTTPNTTGE